MRVVDFKNAGAITKRRFKDLSDRVVDGDPRHETQLWFTNSDGTLWSAPIGWSSLNVSAWWASGLSASCFQALVGGSPTRCAA